MRVEIDIGRLTCKSVFDDRAAQSVAFAVLPGTPEPFAQMKIATRDDVLYLPSVLGPGQSLCVIDNSYVPREAIYDPWTLDFVKSQMRADPQFASQYRGDFEVEESDERVCILGNVFSRNFAHWTEELLKVVIIESLGLACKYVYASLPAFTDAFLELMAVPPHRILKPKGPVRYASALFTPAISHENIVSYPFVAEQLRRSLLSGLVPATGSRRRRLWLDRGQMVTNGGSTLNRDELARSIARYGFEHLDMATLPVRDQLQVVMDAEILAGPHGAQFAHIMFMPPRSHVIECFSPTYVNPSVLQICRILGHSYHQIVSRANYVNPYTHGRDLIVDCEHLELVLDHLVSALPAIS
jgi:hypothetical protein